MNSFFSRETFLHPIILASYGTVVLIAVGSVMYYVSASAKPASTLSFATSTAATIIATGLVEPSQNPDLTFQSPGRIAGLYVKVGQEVSRGQVLAELNTADLRAQLQQAKANVDVQEAKLSGLRAGARPEDVAASQASADKSAQDLSNLYASIADSASDSFAKANDAVRVQLNQFFTNGETNTAKLTYTTGDSQAQINAEKERITATLDLDTWQKQISDAAQSQDALDALLKNSISYLDAIRQLLNDVSKTLQLAPDLSATILATYKTYATAALTEVNTATKNLNTIAQSIQSQKLTVSQMQAQLQLKKAGATQQDIDAQEAQLESAKAAAQGVIAKLSNAEIIAPFSGTVSSVHLKVGDDVLADVPIISLTPQSALQITVYVSEVDSAKIAIGDTADVTLDAYGSSRHWSAAVIAIDHSPSMQQGIPSYKTTLLFQNSDPTIASGMTANVIITLSHQ